MRLAGSATRSTRRFNAPTRKKGIRNMARIMPEIVREDHLVTLRNCGGYYACPKTPEGKRIGPLVGYAAKYVAPDGQQLQWVGDVYVNFAKAEPCPQVLEFFALSLMEELETKLGLANIDVFCGAPIGGYSLADALGMIYPDQGIQTIKAEKKVTALATDKLREQSKLVFGRHSIERGRRYVIVEDVCNNFSTTEELIALICSAGGEVVAITCFLNRSLTVNDVWHSAAAGRDIPIISLVRKPIHEWHQDDPAVADDIAAGKVELKPKDNWGRLMQAMDTAV